MNRHKDYGQDVVDHPGSHDVGDGGSGHTREWAPGDRVTVRMPSGNRHDVDVPATVREVSAQGFPVCIDLDWEATVTVGAMVRGAGCEW